MKNAGRSEYDLRIDASWVACVDDSDRLLKDHSVFVHDGRVGQILPTVDVREIPVKATQTLKDHILIPGLINAHGHAAMTLFRGLANDMPLQTWLQEHIWPAEGAWVNEDFVQDGTQLAIAEMLLGGTTCFSDMYFFPETAAKVAETTGIRAQLCCPILDFPTAWGSGPDEYISKTLALSAQYKESTLVHIAFGPHAPYTVSDAPLEKIRELAQEHAIPVQMHVHETLQEVTDALEATQARPIQRLAKLGFFELENFQCVHMTALNQEDIDLIKCGNTSVVHCPESNMKLASGFAPVQSLLDAGVCVSLGTDGAASNNDLDMFGEMRTAALIAKGYTGDAAAVNAHTALRMATINGAKTLGLDDQIGSIETGKFADLCAVSLRHLNTTPSYDPIADLVYNTNAAQVSHVWVAGNALVVDKQLRTVNVDDTLSRAQEWANKIRNNEPS